MNNKIILISGTSRGLGFDLAEHYGRFSTVIGLSRSGTGPKNCENWICDLTKPEEIQKTITEILEKHSRIDALINNAAILKSAPFLLTPTDEILGMIETNLVAPLLLTRAVLRSMIAKKSGRIVNIISMSHRLKRPGDAVYASTKSALEVFGQILNQEVHPFGITVNAIGLSARPSGMLAPLVKENPEKITKLIPHGAYATLESIVHAIDSLTAPGGSDLGGQTLYLGGISP